MALSQIEEKYINITLAHLYEEIFIYRKKMETGQGNTRDRAIWTALYVKAMRDYNYALGNLGLVGTSNLARLQKPVSDRQLRGEGYDFITDAEIDWIITQAWGISKLERQKQRYELQKKRAEAFVVTQNMSKEVQKAVETLIKHGAVDKLIPLEKLMENKAMDKDKLPNLPRGNPRKGGLVSKFILQGKSKEEAEILAEAQLSIEAQEKAKELIKEDQDMQNAIAQAFIAVPKVDKDAERAKKAMAFLNDETENSNTEPQASLADLNPFEEGGFK